MTIKKYLAKITMSGFALLTAIVSFAQTTVSVDELALNPLRLPALAEVGGSPFMTNDYQPATIQLLGDKIAFNIPVKFNIYNNAIMIQKDGQEFKLESFESVTYNIIGKDGKPQPVVFRQGYPEIDNHNEKAVYQVLSTGPNVHLIKYLSQKVEDAAAHGDYSRREIVTTQQLYVYTPGGEIKRIKASKQSVTEALPTLSAKIEELVSANKLNLKNETAITELVEALNRP